MKPGLSVDLGDGRTVKVQWLHNEGAYWIPGHHGEPATIANMWDRAVPVVGSHVRDGTVCRITIGHTVGGGLVDRQEDAQTVVHPKDSYSRKVGRRVSLVRAMKQAGGASGLSKDDRAAIWTAMLEKGW